MKKTIIRIAILLSFVLSFSYTANIGDIISNTASMTYNIGGVDKNETSNEVNNTIVQTPATIEFLEFSPGGDDESLQPTTYIDSNGNQAQMPPAILPGGSTITPPKTIGMQDTDHYLENDLVMIRVTDIDQDTDIYTQQTIDINITNPSTGDIEVLTLMETGPNTGVFVGYLHASSVKSEHGDGQISVNAGDQISAIYQDNGTLLEVKADAIISEIQFRLITTKKQSKDIAGVGEFVKYTITVENISDILLSNILIEDRLPMGLKYQSDSFKINGVRGNETLSDDGRVISYVHPLLPAGSKVEISYVALIGAGVIDSKAINTAWASSRYGGQSNIAKTILKIQEELYRSKGFILGTVYDANISCKASKEKSKGKTAVIASSPVAQVKGGTDEPKGCGVSGIKLYMEDGRFVITDEDGKYHFSDVSNGTHVVQMDDDSFDGRYKLAQCKQNTRFAGSSRSQFVDLYHGEMARADFCLERLGGVTGDTSLEMSIRKISSNEVQVVLLVNRNMNLINPEVFLALSEGLEYVKASTSNHIEPELSDNMLAISLGDSIKVTLRLRALQGTVPDKEIRGVLYFDTHKLENQKSDIVQVAFTSGAKGKAIQIIKATDSVSMQSVGGNAPVEAGDYNWTKATKQVHMPSYTPDGIDTLGNDSRIVWPPKGWVPNVSSTRVAILYPKGHSVKLLLNNNKVNMINYEGLFRSSNRNMNIVHYKGIDLRQGSNRLVALIKKDGKIVKRVTRDVYVESRTPAKMVFLPKYSYLIADGIHDPIIAVRMIGPSGHPLRGGMVGSFTTDRRHTPKVRSNNKGQYTVDSQGIAYIALKPTSIAGETELKFKLYNNTTRRLTVRLQPHFRDWILVGFAEGTIGYRTLHGNQEALAANGVKDSFYYKGRAAFFAKGRIKGQWLMTMAYDSGRKKGDRKLFDKIDPNAYYTLYNDASSQDSETPSTKKLYLKLERNDFSILFGDFQTRLNTIELAGYSRTFTGAKAEYKGKNLSATLFAAETDKLFFRDEFRGDGTKGFYQLSQKGIVEGSEKIIIEIRKRYREEIVLGTREMQRYREYDIDYDKGTLYFREPMYGSDEYFNPKYVVVKYEVEGDGDHFTYGGRVSVNSDNEKYQAGVTYVNEETGVGTNTLYGIDATAKFTDKLSLKAEYAHSRNGENGDEITGDASKVTMEYIDDNISARAYYRKQDKSFGLGQLSSSLSSTRKIGIDIRKILDDNWSIGATAYQNREYDANSSHNDQNVFELNTNYRDKLWNGSIGYRYAKSTDTEASNQITAKIGRDFYDGNLSVWLSHDQCIKSNTNQEFPTKTAFGLGWKYDANISIVTQIERVDAKDGVSWRSKTGVSYSPWKDSKISYSRIYDTSKDASRIFDTMGLSRTMFFGERWKTRFGYEKGISSGDTKNGDYDAYNIKADYTGETYSSDLSLGYKNTDSEDKLNLDAGIYIKQSEEMGLAAALGYHKNWDNDKETRNVDMKLAFVYRPLETNWIVLSRLDLIDNYTQNGFDETETQKLVSNTHINWQASEKWELGLHYGLKHVVDNIDDVEYASWTDLLGLNARYDFNNKWFIGVQGSILNAYESDSLDYGFGAFIGMTPWKNTVLQLGYNKQGFEDDEFSEQYYYQEGVYVKFRMKFDQDSVKRLVQETIK